MVSKLKARKIAEDHRFGIDESNTAIASSGGILPILLFLLISLFSIRKHVSV